jgi:hypothetical protein
MSVGRPANGSCKMKKFGWDLSFSVMEKKHQYFHGDKGVPGAGCGAA